MTEKVDTYHVVLGPSLELHTGIHGELACSPPTGVAYMLPRHRHHFLSQPEDRPFDPCRTFAVSETVQFALPVDHTTVVHSSRVPVFNSVPWLADADCLLSTLSSGTLYALGAPDQPPRTEEQISLRQRTMLSHYLSERCVALLLRSNHARRNLLSFIKTRRLLESREYECIEGKSAVLRPTLVARSSVDEPASRPTVIYMGRFAHGKGSDIATELYRRLRRRYGEQVRLIFVGPQQIKDVSVPGVEHHPVLERNRYLALLAQGSIFLAPTDFESFGFGLIEAACHGLVIVTSRGAGMEHIQELFREGENASLIPTGGDERERLVAFESALCALIDNKEMCNRMRDGSLALFRTGPLNVEHRDRTLLLLYQRMHELARTARQSSNEVAVRCRSVQAQHGLALHTFWDHECEARKTHHPNSRRRVLLSG